jgi:hypothetical protein
MRKLGIGFILTILLLSILSIAIVPSNASATTGSITVAPGETKYISFGWALIYNTLLWNIDISYLGWSLTYWLEKPSGSHVAISYLDYWGDIAEEFGEYKIGFSISSGGIWSATIDYEIHRLNPVVVFDYPLENSYVNTKTINVSGTFTESEFLEELTISTDDIHYSAADTHLGTWGTQVTLADGYNEIYYEARWGWLVYDGYWVEYPGSSGVYLDRENPDAAILTPSNNAAIRGTNVNVSWQRSDNSGIEKQELKIDALGWEEIDGTSHSLNLATGTHTIQLRVTDKAGNQVIKSVTVSVDAEAFSFGGPYYGLPTIGIIAAVVLAAIYMLMRTRKRKKAPTIEPQPIEKPPEPVGDQHHPL